MNKKVKAIFLTVIVLLAILFTVSLFDKQLFFSYVKTQSVSFSTFKSGEFNILIYSPSSGNIKSERIYGIIFSINNLCTQKLTVNGIFNSTFSESNPEYYILVEVPEPNGTVVSAYERTYNIFMGFETVLIPTPNLSPGNYIISLSNGMDINVVLNSSSY
ncbi:hypothetical protein CM19_03775 [Candidatus Acidianus copahuensis]|uniref:Uncharacterized protein n=1 Tax=Candidatus Acidianus copahuensis TaxID=1160895 RepID=A0A031LT28_9CREN|nr:hypothetical protein [Candidatus Acidianus copahuensis]EZQ10619.1 hypothetical protein CM19_03775 [Candidatus Acidianus copahuensis]